MKVTTVAILDRAQIRLFDRAFIDSPIAAADYAHRLRRLRRLVGEDAVIVIEDSHIPDEPIQA